MTKYVIDAAEAVKYGFVFSINQEYRFIMANIFPLLFNI